MAPAAAPARAPRVLLAPDKFKGTLTAAQVCDHLGAGIARAAPWCAVVPVPVADGGEGTLAAALAAGSTAVPVTASGPTGEPVAAAFARRGDVAVVEMAGVSGLAQLPGGRPAPLTASSAGTGELVRAALDAGCRSVVLGLGGSACTDGGAGMVRALGARLTGADGEPVAEGGAALAGATRLDLTGLDPRLREAAVVVACDVDDPLLGPRGAAAVYGPQKGADPAAVALLERGLARWAQLVTAATGADPAAPGAGAAGGTAFAATALLGARTRPGIALVLELVGFADALAGADLVVTGEGCLDEQTLHGKAPAGVAAAARAAGVPVVAVAGRTELTPAQLRAAGFAAAYPLTDEAADLAECLRAPGPLLERVGERIAGEHLPGR